MIKKKKFNERSTRNDGRTFVVLCGILFVMRVGFRERCSKNDGKMDAVSNRSIPGTGRASAVIGIQNIDAAVPGFKY
jgi:hypothetical protein